MFWLLIYIINALSCDENCIPCRVEEITFVKNPCDNSIYNIQDSYNFNCETCLLNSTSNSECNVLINQTCEANPKCGEKSFLSSRGNFEVESLQKSSICFWYINLTDLSLDEINLNFQFSSLLQGTLLVEAYNLPNGILLNQTSPSHYRIKVENYKLSSSLSLQNTDFLVLIYYTGNSNQYYSGVSVKWDIPKISSNTLGTTLTITALCIASLFCIGCCGILCRRFYKTANGNGRIYNHSITSYQQRTRNYEVIPENSIISDTDIQKHFPKQLFKESLLELGEILCCICFEEYLIYRFNVEGYVRKLPCKHVFHSKCIEEWLVGKIISPKCPLCKYNPFTMEAELGLDKVARIEISK
ncbi:hypothetical protein SteCoe_17172 [Stentor coeruleus]|uniref:RING-type domain-containing protein n=1 Tax=Stentor coeruleus TaxID=5963 RepID=A0A1R2BZQ1_9CILI|nr:hypothetical protein SteCoe_17172 [Stentor coeruleus]